jgi:single-strand DNA-binding protein
MAEDINCVVLVGRLTRDAELMYTSSGFALTKMALAVNRRRKSGDQWIDEGNFFDVTLWGKRGEGLSPYLKKGQQIGVQGQLKQDRWEQDGQKRSRVVIEADNIQLLGSGSSGRSGGDSFGSGNNRPAASPNNSGGQGSYNDYKPDDDRFEDDVPF